MTDLVSGPEGVVVVGNSIPQPDAPNGTQGTSAENRNAFAISATASGAHTTHWLTSFPATGGATAGEVRAVQVGTDRYALLFDVHDGSTDTLDYRLINSAGTVLASASFPNLFYATICEPILIGTTVYWVGIPSGSSSPATAYLYGLSVANPAAPTVDPRALKLLTATPKPLISGTAKVGKTLTATPGTWQPAPVALSYQWLAGGTEIKGATHSTLHVTGKDYRKAITVRVTGTETGYATVSKLSAKTARTAAGALTSARPSLTGTVQVGHKLRAHRGSWRPSAVTFHYKWYAGGQRFGRSCRTTCTLGTAQTGKRITVAVVGAKHGYRTKTRKSKPTHRVQP